MDLFSLLHVTSIKVRVRWQSSWSGAIFIGTVSEAEISADKSIPSLPSAPSLPQLLAKQMDSACLMGGVTNTFNDLSRAEITGTCPERAGRGMFLIPRRSWVKMLRCVADLQLTPPHRGATHWHHEVCGLLSDTLSSVWRSEVMQGLFFQEETLNSAASCLSLFAALGWIFKIKGESKCMGQMASFTRASLFRTQESQFEHPHMLCDKFISTQRSTYELFQSVHLPDRLLTRI